MGWEVSVKTRELRILSEFEKVLSYSEIGVLKTIIQIDKFIVVTRLSGWVKRCVVSTTFTRNLVLADDLV